MKTKLVSLFCVIICASLMSACSIHHQYEPALHPTDPVKFIALNTVSLDKNVSIINAQETETEILMGNVGVHDYYGSLHDITESAVMHAKAELERRGVNVDAADNSGKSLSLRVTSAKMVRGMWVLRAIIDMSVVTGSGLTKTYHVENVTPLTVPRAYNGAALISVAKMFSDPDILEYLSE